VAPRSRGFLSRAARALLTGFVAAGIWVSCGGDSGGLIGDPDLGVLVELELMPRSVTIVVGANRRFVALGRYSTGATESVDVAWSATGGMVAADGNYAAGVVPGTFSVVATASSGLSDTAQVVIANPPPTNGVTDITRLPAATGQHPNVAAWNALDVPGLQAGGSYLDPTTGVRVWKLTSPTVPQPNDGAGHDYGDGPVQVSREWGGGKHTVLVRVGDLGYWLVDLERGVGLSNWRRMPSGAAPGGDLHWSFSKNPLTPQIAYSFTGNQLVRVNTATGTVENTGNFPVTLPAGTWLQQDQFDEWFVKLSGSSQVVAWNSGTNQVITQSLDGLDEPHLEGHGRYVAMITEGGARIWDLQTNTVSDSGWRVWTFHHNASMLGHWISVHVDGPVFNFRLEPAGDDDPVGVNIFEPGMATYQHGAGQWVQPDVPEDEQYAVISSYGNLANGGEIWTGALLKAAIGFLRSDGGDARLLAHAYVVYDNGDYWELPKATPSPDGKVVIFDSDMQNSGRYDLFLVEVPVDPDGE